MEHLARSSTLCNAQLPMRHFFQHLLISIAKSDLQRGESERKIVCWMIQSSRDHYSHCCISKKQKPGGSSRSPMRVHDPKDLSCPLWLSQDTSRELDGKQATGITTVAHTGSRCTEDNDFRH